MNHQYPHFYQQQSNVSNNNMRPPGAVQGQFFAQQQMQQYHAQLQQGMLAHPVTGSSGQPQHSLGNTALNTTAPAYGAGPNSFPSYGAGSFGSQVYTASSNMAATPSIGSNNNTVYNHGMSANVAQGSGSKTVPGYGSGIGANTTSGMPAATSSIQWQTERNSDMLSSPQMMRNTNQPGTNQNSRKNKPRCITLPHWLKLAISTSEPSSKTDSLLPCVREVYTRALGLVECSSTDTFNSNSASNAGLNDQVGGSRNGSTSEWVETNRVSLLLLRTGLHANVLAVLWELVSCSRAGQLSRTECAGLLALIALVQSGQHLVSAEVLEKLEEPVVPVIDHPALVPFIQQFQQSKIQLQNPQQDPLSFQQSVAQLLPNHTTTGTVHSHSKPNSTAQPSNWQTSENRSIGGNDSNDADEFADFVAAPLPCAGNVSSAAGSSTSFNATLGSNLLHPSSVIPSQLSSSNFPLQPQSSAAPSVQPLNVSPLLNGTSTAPATEKRMNLPKVGCSPENSPSLSCENSAEDDFDDFQSATSEPAGMLSSDGSPRSTHHQFNGTSKAGISSTNGSNAQHVNLTQPTTDVPSISTGQFADFSSTFAPSASSGAVDTGLSLLKPAKINSASSEDKYAAFRDLDFGEADTAEQVSIQNPGLPQSSIGDDSFGDFCSANKSSDDDGFGDFTSATLSLPAVSAATDAGSAFTANFETGFSTMSLESSFGQPSMGVHSAPNSVLPLNSFEEGSLFASSSDNTGSSSPPNNSCGEKNQENLKRVQVNSSLPSGTTSQSTNACNYSKNIGAGPSDWSDIFGVLHDKPRTEPPASHGKVETQTLPEAPFTGFSDEPPPFPETSGDEFGDFVLAGDGAATATTVTPTSHPLPNYGGVNAEPTHTSLGAPLGQTKSNGGELFDVPPPLSASADPSGTNFVGFYSHGNEAPPPFAGVNDLSAVTISASFHNAGIDTKASLPPTELPPPLDDEVSLSKSGSVKQDSIGDHSSLGDRTSPGVCSDAVSLDKYSSFREDALLGSGAAAGEDPAADCWLRCVRACEQLLQEALTALQPLAQRPPEAGDDPQLDWRKIAATQQMKDFIAGTKEVWAVSRRVQQACQRAAPNPALADAFSSCASLSRQLSQLLLPLHVAGELFDASDAPDSTAAPLPATESVCAVCVTPLCSPASSASLVYAGHHYHPGCANLWLNRVHPTLPLLSPASISVL